MKLTKALTQKALLEDSKQESILVCANSVSRRLRALPLFALNFLLAFCLLLSTSQSAHAIRETPVYTFYNTFLDMQNFLELASVGNRTLNAKVSLFAADGTFRIAKSFRVEAGGQTDININEIVGRKDEVGVIRIDFNTSTAELSGRMSFYRFNSDGETYSFAFAQELSTPLNRTTFSIANSFDPQGRKFLVPNWASIVNLDQENTQSFTHNLYDLGGTLIRTTSVTLAPNERRDLPAGHENGENVYLNEFIPASDTVDYMSFVTRYGRNSRSANLSTDYTFAFPIVGRAGNAEDEYVPVTNLSADCWTQTNWVEVVNVSNASVTATAEYRGEDGVRFETASQVIPPRGQFHFDARNVLRIRNRERGSVKISSSTPNALISQSAFYYHDCDDNSLQTAYTVVGTPPMNGTINGLNGSYNRFLGIQNLVTVIGANGFDKRVLLELKALLDPMPIFSESFDIRNFSILSFNLSDEEQFNTMEDTFGTIKIKEDFNRPIIAHNVRTRFRNEGTRVDFAVPTPIK